jgi:cell division protein FtsA
MNSHGIVAIKEKEVMQGDVDRVIDSARAVAIPADQKILHILPQEFVIDRQGGIKDPIGMAGIRLEARVHIVTGSVSAAQNIVKCVRRCGLEVEDIILDQLASCQAVLTEDEKELGVCLVDIGGGTTDMAIFTNGAIRYTAVIPIAGDQVTNDIAVALRTPTPFAEEIKVKHACAMTQRAKLEDVLDVPSMGERPTRQISRLNLAEIVEPRFEELLQLVHAELRRSGFEDMIAGGIVLSGGSCRVDGLTDLAEEIFHMPVRLGLPQYVTGLKDVVRNPAYATAVGLLLFGRQQHALGERKSTGAGGFKNFWGRMRNWLQGNF